MTGPNLRSAPSLGLGAMLSHGRPSDVVTISSWGVDQDDATFRHTLSTNEFFTNTPRPLGTNTRTVFAASKFVQADIFKSYDQYRFDELECWATMLTPTKNPVCVQVWSSVDADDSGPISAGAHSTKKRSNVSRALLTNAMPSKLVAKFCPFLMQEGLTDTAQRQLRTIRHGEWHDVAGSDALKFGCLRQSFVAPYAASYGDEIPAIMLEFRATISLRGRTR